MTSQGPGNGLPPLREVIARHGLTARRALGQNFLLDLNLCRRIARAAGALEGQTVLEVGPGPGGLTRSLLDEGAARVVAVEADPRAVAALAELAEAYSGRLEIIEGDALNLDVTGGEQDCDLTIWKRMIDMRAVNVVQPDVCYLGGITRTLKVAEMARQAGMPCTPHSANLSLVTVFTLHLMGALENAGPYVEFSIEGTNYYPWQEGIYDPALVVKDGKVQIPDGPGWGVEINPDFLEKSQYQISNLK